MPLTIAAVAVASIHRSSAWWVVGFLGAVALIGYYFAFTKRTPAAWFWWLTGLAVVGLLGQIALGLWQYSVDGIDPGNQHVFYGVVIAFTLAFAYIYRGELAKRPALYYGTLLLFLMGLGIRAIATFGHSFGS